MVDRVTSYQLYSRATSEMMAAQVAVNKTQEQISTGKRVLTPADDPISSARILQLDQDIALMDQYKVNGDALLTRLEIEETTLAAIEDNIDRVRELTIRAGNGTLTILERRALAAEISTRYDEMVDLFNAKDSSGEYLFSGFAGRTIPFVENPGGGYVYQGDEGQRFLQISKTISVASSDTGKDLFMDIDAVKPSFTTYGSITNTGSPAGVISAGVTVDQDALNEFFPDNAIVTFNNELDIVPPGPNYTIRSRTTGAVIEGASNLPFGPGQPIQVAGMAVTITGQPDPGDSFVIETSPKQGILETMNKILFVLETSPDDEFLGDILNPTLSDTLNNIDNAMISISEVRSEIGARMNTTESTMNMHEDLKLVAQEIRSDLRDIDFAEAASRLSLETLVLEASQQSYATIQRLSLFNFI